MPRKAHSSHNPRRIASLRHLRRRTRRRIKTHPNNHPEISKAAQRTCSPLDGRDRSRQQHRRVDGEEGAFTPCYFWLVECFARSGKVRRARLHFEKLLSYANEFGLFSEEIGPGGEQLGNTPQALTHLALISAAYAIDSELDRKGPPQDSWRQFG